MVGEFQGLGKVSSDDGGPATTMMSAESVGLRLDRGRETAGPDAVALRRRADE